MPLHWQLTYCNARHLATTTAPTYCLYAMADSMPGLWRHFTKSPKGGPTLLIWGFDKVS